MVNKSNICSPFLCLNVHMCNVKLMVPLFQLYSLCVGATCSLDSTLLFIFYSNESPYLPLDCMNMPHILNPEYAVGLQVFFFGSVDVSLHDVFFSSNDQKLQALEP